MRFMVPKEKNLKQTDWEVPQKIIDLVKAYSEYTDYTENEVVEYYLNQIQEDERFRDWAKKRRNNKKLLKLLEIEEPQSGGTAS
jgi:septation ring formation regulator EzrA